MPGLIAASALALAALLPDSALAFGIEGSHGTRLEAREIATFDEPWAMTFLPDSTMLVTEKYGQLLHVTQSGQKTPVDQMFDVVYGGQGGLGDVILDPDFVDNRQIYLSFIESLDDGATRGAAVVRATLAIDNGQPVLCATRSRYGASSRTFPAGGIFPIESLSARRARRTRAICS